MAIAIIDPGHGGKSAVGGSSANNAKGPTGLLEKDATLDLARRVCDVLSRSVDARLTRKTDINLGLKERATIARQARADAFVSVHFNGFDHVAQGTETWHHSSASSDSKALAMLVQKAALKATGLEDRGVKASAWGVLNPSHHAQTTAACLVEISFMDVAAEEARLRGAAYKDQIATALAAAIEGWLIADGRMSASWSFAASGTDFDETGPQDGYEMRRLGTALDGEPPSLEHDIAPEGEELSLSIDFIPLRESDTNSAAGVENLDKMLRGWRRERLSLPHDDEPLPEVAVGIDESLDAAFLELLARRRQAVGIIRTGGIDFMGRNRRWSGTGFLVAPNILLTNQHVLNSPESAEAAEVMFDYEVSARSLASGSRDQPAPGRSYRLHPEQLFVSSPYKGGLDYSFVWIDDVQLIDGAPLRMERAAFAIQPGERAFVIHHPNGHPKRVSLDDTDIVFARPDAPMIRYTSDTEPGSSGAPVFDRSGRLIALHHASDRNREGYKDSEGIIAPYVNEGIKLAAIALDLETRRAHEASAMIDTVLGEIYGSDTLTGFFGASGRTVNPGQSSADRVIELYDATAQDIDIGFWNVGQFADRYQEKANDVARIIVDLGLDAWALVETSQAATEALVQTIERNFGLQLEYSHHTPDALASNSSAALLWNPTTLMGEERAWPDDVASLFQLAGNGPLTNPRPQSRQKPGRIHARTPPLLRFRSRAATGGGIDVNLVPLHLKPNGSDDARMALQILARAIDEMMRHHGADQDWIVGGDFSAERASSNFDAFAKDRFMPSSAQDEADGALSYLKSPDSLIERVFLSPNMSRQYGTQNFFVLDKVKSQVDYFKHFSGHRPILLRLSTRSAGSAAAQLMAPDTALARQMDTILQRARK